jgi:hypothetical protein
VIDNRVCVGLRVGDHFADGVVIHGVQLLVRAVIGSSTR